MFIDMRDRLTGDSSQVTSAGTLLVRAWHRSGWQYGDVEKIEIVECITVENPGIAIVM